MILLKEMIKIKKKKRLLSFLGEWVYDGDKYDKIAGISIMAFNIIGFSYFTFIKISDYGLQVIKDEFTKLL